MAAEPETPEIGVLLRFDAAPGHAFVATMEREFARILASADLRVHWLETSDGKRSFARALIFTFHGACRGVTDAVEHEPASGPVVLADTPVNGEVVLPYSEMNCDQLRGFLSGDEPQAAGVESRLGLAMARVLAHEMYHVLLQTRDHGRQGISRAVHTPAALLSHSLAFDEEEIIRIRGVFAGSTARAAQNVSFRPN